MGEGSLESSRSGLCWGGGRRREIPENGVPPRGRVWSSRGAADTGSLLLPVWDALCLLSQLPEN